MPSCPSHKGRTYYWLQIHPSSSLSTTAQQQQPPQPAASSVLPICSRDSAIAITWKHKSGNHGPRRAGQARACPSGRESFGSKTGRNRSVNGSFQAPAASAAIHEPSIHPSTIVRISRSLIANWQNYLRTSELTRTTNDIARSVDLLVSEAVNPTKARL